ncbi:Trypanosomal VSG domain/Trypanosome variant surface glycoprotein C-terminal domain containing protein, putative [Trypanosoma equiperdum]|uniref:Trypanosomal VSG domain/Trypanosome variant surface glycoprotein C-terminal domain containing protein, putative n=1 Tax=Trypanosoma equiperdum TaxID=5694 RepID=A0A1G4IAI8_TRYEQ|nr:Trypanosomal VSG domain/Trypanosome variant surface glycoprotein C-terminal domain containing protein, putative [Trypanosoma equiperdum]
MMHGERYSRPPKAKKNWTDYKKSRDTDLKTIDWSDRWDDWQRAHTETKDPQHVWHKKYGTSPTKLPGLYRRQYINTTAERALQLLAEYKAKLQGEEKGLAEEINELLDQAICSSPLAKQPTDPTCTDVPGGATKSETCIAANAGKSIAHDIVCLCAAQDDTDSCATTNIQASMISTTNFHADALKTATELCGINKKPTNLADAITEAIAALAGQISNVATGEHKPILGKTHNGNACTGTDAACVYYTNKFTQGEKGLTAIPWISALIKARSKYRQYEQQMAQKATTEAQIKQLLREALKEYNRPDAAQQPLSVQKSLKNLEHEDLTEKQKKECEDITKSQECKNNGNCKWTKETEETGKHCKLNATAAEQQATQAGTGGGATGTEDPNCGQYTDPKKCSKAPGKQKEGKKAVCGWIDDKCKDSSFLANKKLTMIVFYLVGFVAF